jgi:hypothetical protein
LTEPTPPDHLRVRGRIDEATQRLALRAALTAAHRLGLAAGAHLRKLRAMKDPLADLHARLQEADLRARLAWEMVEILGARFARIPEKNRPYYTPSQRFRITEIKNLLAWNAAHTAKAFLLCANTIRNWERSADPTAKTVGSKVSPIPPVRRAADIVRATVQTMTRLGFGGQDLVARTLARAGWTVSARSGRPPPQGARRPSAHTPGLGQQDRQARHRPLRPSHQNDGRERGEAVARARPPHRLRLRRLLARPPRPSGLRRQARRGGHDPPAAPCRTGVSQAQVPPPSLVPLSLHHGQLPVAHLQVPCMPLPTNWPVTRTFTWHVPIETPHFETGTLNVTSSPAGAQVVIGFLSEQPWPDGQMAGSTAK